MSLRHWCWIMIGLLFWAALVFVWSTSPDICEISAARSTDHCQRR